MLLTDDDHHATEIRWYTEVSAQPAEDASHCSTHVFTSEVG